MDKKTIAAIATPTGRGGIGIIRVSGPDAFIIAKHIFVLPSNQCPDNLQSHHVYYGYIQETNGHRIDEVLLVPMKGPRSYTAEDVIEIQSHSSPIVLRRILEVILSSGADIAEPGEFTKRAYLNGRIDLTQAEAVIDIINARTATSLDMAVSQIQGHLKKQISRIHDILANEQARFEALLDFPDDVDEIIDKQKLISHIETDVRVPLSILKKSFNENNMYRDGIKIVIAGPPNSGKSSLMNALLNKEKSIVTSIPGTTRDLIDDLINIDGIPFEITDTAGIQETKDHVEKIGIAKTFDKINVSDIILLMYDGSTSLSEKDRVAMLDLYNTHKQTKMVFLVENKIDLQPNQLNVNQELEPDIRISVREKQGLEQLKIKIADAALRDMPEDRSSVVPNIRHMRLIENALHSCESIIKGLNDGRAYELIALDFKDCVMNIGEVLGVVVQDDLLDRIFNTFCIGK